MCAETPQHHSAARKPIGTPTLPYEPEGVQEVEWRERRGWGGIGRTVEKRKRSEKKRINEENRNEVK
jgi:hypothetical protein